jgi:CheY-like chemotaxis protein
MDRRFLVHGCRSYLQQAGYPLLTPVLARGKKPTASGGYDRHLAKQLQPDLAILDVRLADMSGLDVFDGLREIDPRFSHQWLRAGRARFCRQSSNRGLAESSRTYSTMLTAPSSLSEASQRKNGQVQLEGSTWHCELGDRAGPTAGATAESRSHRKEGQGPSATRASVSWELFLSDLQESFGGSGIPRERPGDEPSPARIAFSVRSWPWPVGSRLLDDRDRHRPVPTTPGRPVLRDPNPIRTHRLLSSQGRIVAAANLPGRMWYLQAPQANS